jgi:hypothetical protein
MHRLRSISIRIGTVPSLICIASIDLDPVEFLLERTEQSLDPAVHPRAARYTELLPDTGKFAFQPQRQLLRQGTGSGRTDHYRLRDLGNGNEVALAASTFMMYTTLSFIVFSHTDQYRVLTQANISKASSLIFNTDHRDNRF